MNAVITCRLCAKRYDKGAPADPTQDDSTFVCGPCSIQGYPQDGWINPLARRPDALLHPEVTPVTAEPKPSFFKRLFGKK